MAGRRKGEISPAQLDREWPHQVAIPETRRLGHEQGIEIYTFCKPLSLAPRTHTVAIDGEWHIVYCFAVRTDAEAFRTRFDGVSFDPARRGQGHAWYRYRPAE